MIGAVALASLVLASAPASGTDGDGQPCEGPLFGWDAPFIVPVDITGDGFEYTNGGVVILTEAGPIGWAAEEDQCFSTFPPTLDGDHNGVLDLDE